MLPLECKKKMSLEACSVTPSGIFGFTLLHYTKNQHNHFRPIIYANTKQGILVRCQVLNAFNYKPACVWILHIGKADPQVLVPFVAWGGPRSQQICHVAICIPKELLCLTHHGKILRPEIG
jgi:hypothetical protein